MEAMSNTAVSPQELGNKYFSVGWGAVVDDGIGVCYSYTPKRVQFKVSTRMECPVSADAFAERVRQAILDVCAVLAGPPTARL